MVAGPMVIKGKEGSSLMAVQTLSRQVLLDKMSSVFRNLSDDQLQQLWEDISGWQDAAVTRQANGVADRAVDSNAVLEFTISPQKAVHPGHVRLPIHTTKPLTKAVMEIGEMDDTAAFTQRLHANIAWWNENYAGLRNDPALAEQYVAISNGALFSGNTYAEALRKANQADKDAAPYIFFLKAPNGLNRHAH